MNATIELEIGPGPTAGTYSVHVVDSLAGGTPSAVMTLDVEKVIATLPQLEAGILASSVSARRVMSARESIVRGIGESLFDTTFAGRIGESYRASVAIAAERGLEPQVALRLTAPELAAMPWEAMYNSESGGYVSRKEPLVRRFDSSVSPKTGAIAAPLRILGMVSSPRGLQALDVEAEKERMTSALADHLADGRIELVWLDDMTWSGLHRKLLRETWHVLHYIGHGGYDPERDEGLLALVGRDGRADFVAASSLADLLNEAGTTPRLVVLNSCQSGATGSSDLFSGTAAALVRSGISAVVAMQFSVTDDAALAFTAGFYDAIASGRRIDEAVRSGRIGILGIARETFEWITPVLYLGSDATELLDASTLPPARTSTPAADHRVPATADAATPRAAEPPPEGPTRPDRTRAAAATTPSGNGRRRTALIAGGVGAALIVAGAITWWASSRGGDADPAPSASSIADETPEPGPTVLPAVSVPVDAAAPWSQTGVVCNTGDLLEITATGTAFHDLGPTSAVTPVGLVLPDGTPDPAYLPYTVEGLPDTATASLIGSLDTQQPLFAVGTSASYVCPRAGTLYLGINDRELRGNHGTWQAEIVRIIDPQ
ncbi:hypothetical protein GCM10009775_11130 [Microbacterium aoyamense]|uniref:CHAT domain-containing protein n=1 Tax=Microbacterium aoyamense TaxID=344166 RepID=A0ABP5AUX3_9MICO|nr:CHAT domain-containing protein [Microbacterium aoyamense]